MRTYDEKGRRVPSRRDGRPSSWPVALMALALVGLVFLTALMVWRHDSEAASKATYPNEHATSPMTIGYDHHGEPTRFYAMVDPDTGAQYIWTDKGGICPRVDRDGQQVYSYYYPGTTDVIADE